VSNLLFSLQLALGTKRGWSLVIRSAFALFGFVAAGFSIYAAVAVPTKSLPHEFLIYVGVGLGSLVFGVCINFPRSRTTVSYTHPEMKITVRRGDLFAQRGQLVVGFSDTFDTDTTDDRIISSMSVQGQLLNREFAGDREALDLLLRDALPQGKGQEIVEADKPHGKRWRYPIGTTAVITNSNRRIYCVAYSSMGNDLVATSSIEYLWESLGKLWDEVYRHGQQEAVAVPILGSELARIENVDRESLIRLILLSFVARSREALLCKELVVVVHSTAATSVNMLEVRAFMRSL
jgi:hypothetical protein